MFPVVAAVAAGYVLLRGSRRNPRRRRRNPGERNVSDEALADAKLTRRVLKQVRDEINGSDREAYNHWMVISDRTRNYYRDAAGEPRSNPLRRGHSRATISANIRKLRHEGYGAAQAAAIAYSKARKRRNPLSVKRSAEFQEFGTYDVTLSDGSIVQIARDAGNTNWWHANWWPTHQHNDTLLGFTKAEALAKVEDWVARRIARYPGEAAKNVRRANPRRRKSRR